jgi:hypothetical protein
VCITYSCRQPHDRPEGSDKMSGYNEGLWPKLSANTTSRTRPKMEVAIPIWVGIPDSPVNL